MCTKIRDRCVKVSEQIECVADASSPETNLGHAARAACVVSEKPARSAVARHERSVSHLDIGSYAAADKSRSCDGEIPPLLAKVSVSEASGAGQAVVRTCGMEWPGVLPACTQFAGSGKSDRARARGEIPEIAEPVESIAGSRALYGGRGR